MLAVGGVQDKENRLIHVLIFLIKPSRVFAQCSSLYASLGYSNLFDWLTFKNVSSGVLRQTAGLISQLIGGILLYACDSGAVQHSHTFIKL